MPEEPGNEKLKDDIEQTPKEVPDAPIDESVVEHMKSLQKRVDEEREKENRTGEKIADLREGLEGKFEKVPTEQEVSALIEECMEQLFEPDRIEYEVLPPLTDKKGAYRMEVKFERKGGEVVGYLYTREAELNNQSSGTFLYEAVYDKDGGFIKFPDLVAKYNSQTGEWKKL